MLSPFICMSQNLTEVIWFSLLVTLWILCPPLFLVVRFLIVCYFLISPSTVYPSRFLLYVLCSCLRSKSWQTWSAGDQVCFPWVFSDLEGVKVLPSFSSASFYCANVTFNETLPYFSSQSSPTNPGHYLLTSVPSVSVPLEKPLQLYVHRRKLPAA